MVQKKGNINIFCILFQKSSISKEMCDGKGKFGGAAICAKIAVMVVG
jgi:hypothetical protein